MNSSIREFITIIFFVIDIIITKRGGTSSCLNLYFHGARVEKFNAQNSNNLKEIFDQNEIIRKCLFRTVSMH